MGDKESPGTSQQQPANLPIPINIPVPSKLLVVGDLATNWKRFIRSWNNYEIATHLKDPTRPEENKTLRTATFLTCLGSDGMDIFDGLTFENDTDKDDIDIVIKKLGEYCIGQKNETFERYNFNVRAQQEGESVDAYFTALKTLAKTCNFGSLESDLLRDRIVIGIRDNATRKKLLNMPKLTLKECMDVCRTHESTSQQLKTMSQPEVNRVQAKSDRHQATKVRKSQFTPKETVIQCMFCGRKHVKDRNKCPAWGKECTACGKPNHWADQCRSSSQSRPRQNRKAPVNTAEQASSDEEMTYQVEVQEETDSDEYIATLTYEEFTNSVHHEENPNKVFVTLVANGVEERFQLDSGATVNVISDETLAKLCGINGVSKLDKCNTTLVMYNKSKVKPIGRISLSMVNPKNGHEYTVEFIVVKGKCKSILGLQTCKQLELLTINHQNISLISSKMEHQGSMTVQGIAKDFADVFSGEGKLEGKLHLELESVTPVQLPPRRVPLSIKEKLQAELERLSKLGIIQKVDKPTEWISSLVVTTKRNGKVRLCIDPKPLNRALKRNHYPLPTIEDVLPLLANARVFTVLDAKNGFWHIQLDEPSSFLTTFSTPWGRFRWLRMPFGLAPAPEEFQRRIDMALEGLEGVKAIADDILVFGKGITEESADKNHDEHLKALLERCRIKGIKINKDKIQFKQKQVSYMGHMITENGLKPDPNKIKAIVEMPTPTDKEGVQRILGMINYVQRFAPNLTDVTKPLRDLIKKENEFIWDETVHGKALQEAKEILTQAPVLKYFDPGKQPVLQCDASKDGLGACLIQEGHPIAFASRALTPTEINYAQIEKELLSVVFGMEKFSEYLYGRKVLVESDHKPLECIVKKGLLSAPKRLQRMLLRLQKFEFDVVYKRGTQMYMADTLSRAYPKTEQAAGETDREVFNTNDDRSATEKDAEAINMLHFLPLRDTTITSIQKYTEEDPDLQALATVIKNGWPESKDNLPSQLHCFYTFRDELSIQNGIIFKGERVVIPAALRTTMMDKLHSSHLGIQGTLRRAREVFYWPKMNENLTDYMSRCEICNSYKTEQQKEPMICHEPSTRPWESIVADLFDFHGKDYLVTTDRYSNFFEVDRLYSKSSKEVITKLKAHIARYGLPDKLMTDNGPQFASGEFKHFTETYTIEHVTSSPTSPQSNGKAENSVKKVKNIMQKALDAHVDPYLAILDFRNTPTEGLGVSPAQCMLNRRTKTLLPMSSRLLKPELVPDVKQKQERNQAKQAFYYDKSSKELKPLSEGDVVRVKPQRKDPKWIKAKVKKQVDIRSYQVRTEDGRMFRRNRKHLHKTPESYHQSIQPGTVNAAVKPTDQTEAAVTSSQGHSATTETTPQGQTRSPIAIPPISSQTAALAPLNRQPQQSQPSSPSRVLNDSQAAQMQGYTTRSGRIVQKPSYLKDYKT